jgi:GT2 family glycosyltransferase
MISIITAVYNLFDMNRLFVEYLEKYTTLPYELIIIDNGSTDGSREFFIRKGATVICNNANYSYPHCQNQGIEVAKYEYLVFLNNDILVSKDWDKRAIEIMQQNGLEVATCCATDKMETKDATYRSQKKWKYVRNPLLFLFGCRKINLKLMHWLQYGNWDRWNRKRYNRFGNQVKEGIAGSNVIIKRSAFNKIGKWDDRLQAADFDIFLRAKIRSITESDIKPVHIMLGVYLHHFIRLSFKSIQYPPFADGQNIIPLNQKWNIDEVRPYLDAVDM